IITRNCNQCYWFKSLCFTCVLGLIFTVFTLILMIILEEKLHDPMYIFLCNLCFNSLYGPAAFYPKFLYDLLSNSHVISYTGCLLQVFVIYSYATTDFSVLALMAYDRYVAICRPLNYHSVMTKRRVVVLMCFSRFVPMLCQTIVMILTSKLQLCGSRIEKLYCDNWSILKLSCTQITTNNIVGFIVIIFYFAHVVYICFSYVHMIKSAVKSREGRRKFLQTCVPHLLCLLNVTVAMLFDLMYARYGSTVPQTVRNFMAVQFLTLPPLLNPIIYGLNLTQVRKRLFSLCTHNKQGLG
uniref:G-protein coupled receptors family 1 profile domain-containing protein n=1 Tax=Cynoglossus semilaevis TaxID=244447 RepID=A0A3P8W7F9_CYNSE